MQALGCIDKGGMLPGQGVQGKKQETKGSAPKTGGSGRDVEAVRVEKSAAVPTEGVFARLARMAAEDKAKQGQRAKQSASEVASPQAGVQVAKQDPEPSSAVFARFNTLVVGQAKTAPRQDVAVVRARPKPPAAAEPVVLDDEIISIRTVLNPKRGQAEARSSGVPYLPINSMYYTLIANNSQRNTLFLVRQAISRFWYESDQAVLCLPHELQDAHVIDLYKCNNFGKTWYLEFLCNHPHKPPPATKRKKVLASGQQLTFNTVISDPEHYFVKNATETVISVFITDQLMQGHIQVPDEHLFTSEVDIILSSAILSRRVVLTAKTYLRVHNIDYTESCGFSIASGYEENVKKHFETRENRIIMIRLLRHLRCLRADLAYGLLAFLFYLIEKKKILISDKTKLVWIDQVRGNAPYFPTGPPSAAPDAGGQGEAKRGRT